MKLVSLNTWGAAQGDVFYNFVAEHAQNTDIFCFQEVFDAGAGAPEIYTGIRPHQLEEIKLLMPGFDAYFDAKSSGYTDDTYDKTPWPVSIGNAVFIKKDINVLSCSAQNLVGSPAGLYPIEGQIRGQVLDIKEGSRQVRVINVHGISKPGTKTDTPERLEQSRELLKIIDDSHSPVILCGDMNLDPATESIAMLETKLKNLIKEFSITNTRNEVSWAKHSDKPKQYFADYTFVSPEIKVNSFDVPYCLVSDHLPMILEFELCDTNRGGVCESGEYANAPQETSGKILYEALSFKINGILFKVQNELGRYCNEKQYADAVEKYLKLENLRYQREVILLPSFEGEMPGRNKCDFIIEDKIILELKVKRFLGNEDYYQCKRYLSSTNKKLAILVNFRDQRIKPKRIINSAGTL